MLVLARKAGEAIELGDDIRITVLSVRGSTIRLGIEAAESIPIRRPESHPSQPQSQPETRRIRKEPSNAMGTAQSRS
jgi:carbon storage regulator